MSILVLSSLVLGMVLTFFQAYISYHRPLQDSVYYYPIGILINIIAAVLWYYIAKNTVDKATFFASLVWDSFIVFAFVLVPILMFDMSLSRTEMLGTCLVLIGILLLRV